MGVPDSVRSRVSERKLAGVQSEIVQEKAASLARAGARLEAAIEQLEALDSAPPGAHGVTQPRDELVAAAGEALWYYVVQREACGLRDVDVVLREFRVPREVYLRMGLASMRRGGQSSGGADARTPRS